MQTTANGAMVMHPQAQEHGLLKAEYSVTESQSVLSIGWTTLSGGVVR
jgi:hypothetical protein